MPFKNLLKKVTPSPLRSKLKRQHRRLQNKLNTRAVKTTLDNMQNLLFDDFGIRQGNNLIVGSSFGNLNATFSPQELIVLLQEIVGEKGNIVMPFYPPGNSYEWALRGQAFDMKTTRSSMGILTQIFSEMPDVIKSMHPTKAMVAWGKNAQEIVAGHENSKTPFYWDSPYGWLLKHASKSLGLGVKNNPMFHACEDVLSDLHPALYFKDKFALKVVSGSNVVDVEIFVHNPQVLNPLMAIGDYIKTLQLDSYRRVNFGYSFCYCLENQELLKRCEIEFEKGNYRYRK